MTLHARRVLTLAAIGLAVFAAMSAALWFFMWRPTRYFDEEHRFSIRFSPEWEFIGPGEGASARARRTAADSDGVSAAAISVLASPIENIPDAGTYRSWFVHNVVSKFKGYTRIEEGTRATPAGRVPWIVFIHRAEGDLRGQVWQFFYVRDNKGFIISCAAPPSFFERYRREFEEAVDSFQLE